MSQDFTETAFQMRAAGAKITEIAEALNVDYQYLQRMFQKGPERKKITKQKTYFESDEKKEEFVKDWKEITRFLLGKKKVKV